MNDFQHILFSRKPAEQWVEAYPLGNGRMGAMVHGGISRELLSLNEDTLWSGIPVCDTIDNFYEHYTEVRRLVDERKFAEADSYVPGHLNTERCNSASYQPAGDLLINFAGMDDDAAQTADYKRTLDLRSGLCVTEFSCGKQQIKRTAFASYPDSVIVVRLESQEKMDCSIALKTQMDGVFTADQQTVSFAGTLPYKNRNSDFIRVSQDGETGLSYCIKCRVISCNGDQQQDAESVKISQQTHAVLVLAIRSNFLDYKTTPADSPIDPEALAEQDLANAAILGYDALLARHISDHQALYNRSELLLPEDETDSLPTFDRIIVNHEKGGNPPPSLASLVYHYGRYLTIASSRPGTQATNLQGIWNHLLSPPWASNYTTNINTEMNYWHTESANLAECGEPLFSMIRDLSEKGRYVAEELYHSQGWCFHHNTDIWRFCLPASGMACWSLWPMGGGWMCRHLTDHYRFNPQNREFLEKIYPIISGSAAFMLGILRTRQDGQLETCPSTSPENGFVVPGTKDVYSAVAAGTLMDMSIIRDLFDSVLECAEQLGCTDDPVCVKVKEALPKLLKPAIGSDGQLLEYAEDFEECDINHRHLSHLYGFYPGTEMSQEENRDFYAEAVRRSMERRGDMSTGWAMGWRAVIWARLGDGDHVCRILHNFLTPIDPVKGNSHGGGIYANGFDAHPPFQIDGNFGITAAIVEMFLQSHRRTAEKQVILDLYPAVPESWKNQQGRFSGLRAQGGIDVDLEWNEGVLKASIVSASDQTVCICLGDRRELVVLQAGQQYTI